MNRRRKGHRISSHSPEGKGINRREATMGAVKKFFDDRKNHVAGIATLCLSPLAGLLYVAFIVAGIN
jgi:hypothetical protein